MTTRKLAVLFILLLPITVITAQQPDEDEHEQWLVEQRCVAESTPPPDNWTFDGTILMTGQFGIHGVDRTHDTPFVASFFNRNNDFISRAGLSPNGKWYAISEGNFNSCEYAMCGSANVDLIRIYNTENPRENHIIEWELFYDFGSRGLSPELYWIDDNHLFYENNAYQGVQIEIFTGETELWEGVPVWGRSFANPSPDWTRVIYDTGDCSRGGCVWQLMSKESQPGISLPIRDFEWKSDSSGFAAITLVPDSTGYSPEFDKLVLYDRDGNLIDTILDVPDEGISNVMRWSPDNQQLIFSTDTLQIVDLAAKRVVDTCIPVDHRSRVWSPDGRKIAFHPSNHDRLPVRVFDLDLWQQFTVAYHQGVMIGWRE